MRAPWLFRAAWLILPFLVGPVLADGLDATSTPGRTVVSVALWAVWAATLLATLIPRTVTLTAVRLIAPAALGAAIWATVEADFDEVAAVGLIGASVVAALAFDPALGEVFVNGSSYGHEQRMPLRPPAAVLLGPLPAAWLVSAAGLVVGPLLLAYGIWVPGFVVTAVGAPLAALAIRSLHTLSRRWLVFVPGGLVAHDPLVLREPVLMPSATVTGLVPAPAESDDERLDLTGRAPGLALQIELDPAVGFGMSRRQRLTEVIDATEVLVTPTRANRVLSVSREQLQI